MDPSNMDPSKMPAAPPPPGTIPNFVDPENHSRQIMVAAIICPIIAGIFVIARIYTRASLTRSLGWDDYTSIAAMGFSIAYCVIESQTTKYGAGVHMWNVPATDFLPYFLRTHIIAVLVYIPAIFFFKTSVCLLYLRLFRPNKTFRYATFLVLFIVFAYNISNWLCTLLLCRPIQKAWYPPVDPQCVARQNTATQAGVIMNLISDVMIFVLPLPMVWSLELRLMEKIQVTLVFMTGLFIVAVSIVRLAFTYGFVSQTDTTWASTQTFTWSIIEVNVGIMCACMPTLRALLKQYLPKGDFLISSFKLHFSRRSKETSEGSNGRDGSDTYLNEPGRSRQDAYVRAESVDSRGENPIEPHNIRKTVDVNVNYPNRENSGQAESYV
ncbi:MAG: protein disulfide-isomerase precursor [Chaenotheca gracillima]|nr:MAG: protein disulfide-isomerase precursor [Chaenotheca gracillima]